MAQQHLAPLRGTAFHLHHLVHLERLESWMREIEGNGNSRHACRREPFVSQITIGPQGHSARSKLVVKVANALLKLAPLNADAQIADADIQQLLVSKRDPRRLCSHLHAS